MTIKRNTETNLREAYRVFFEALKSGSVEFIVQAASQFFHLPVLVTDENYKLISQYPKQKIGVDIWDSLFEKSVLDIDTVKSYQEEYLKNIKHYYNPFYADHGLVKDCPRIFAEVYTEEKIVGHVAIFMFQEPLYPDDLACVQVFVDALRFVMTTHSVRDNSAFSEYLRDLIDPKSPMELKLFASNSLSANIPGSYSVMALPVGEAAANQAFATMILSDIPTIYRSAVSTLWDGYFVTLFGLMSGEKYTDREKLFFGRVFDYVSLTGLKGGISRPFADIADVKGHFLQASMTARFAKKSYEFFDDVFPVQIFDFVCRQGASEYFIHPVLYKLSDYDAQNNTDYFKTLEAYLLCMSNKELCAKKLCVHRNTLLYRLNRIQELFGIPYNNADTALALLNSFQLWRAEYNEHM